MASAGLKLTGQVQVDALIAEAGGGLNTGELLPLACGEASLLGKLPLRADEGVSVGLSSFPAGISSVTRSIATRC